MKIFFITLILTRELPSWKRNWTTKYTKWKLLKHPLLNWYIYNGHRNPVVLVADGGPVWAQQHGFSLTNARFLIVTSEDPSSNQRRPIVSLQYETIVWGLKKPLDDKSTLLGPFLLRVPFLPAEPQPTLMKHQMMTCFFSNLYYFYYLLINVLWFFSHERLCSQTQHSILLLLFHFQFCAF